MGYGPLTCSLIRPVMVHNFDTLRSHLMLTATYAASPGFLDGLGWQVENSGHVVVNKESSEDCVITVVGKMIDYRYFVGPQGNYSSEEFGDLSTAKYLFHLEKASDTPFEEDFDKALHNFEKIQAQVASTLNRVNFIASDAQTRMLWFTRNVFEKRVSGFSRWSKLRNLICLSVHASGQGNIPSVFFHYEFVWY